MDVSDVQIIHTFNPVTVYSPNPPSVADLDGDGDLDVTAADSAPIFWLKNEDGNGTFGLPNIVHNSVPKSPVFHS